MAAVSVKRAIEVGPVLSKNFASSKYRTLTCDLYRLTVSGGTALVPPEVLRQVIMKS